MKHVRIIAWLWLVLGTIGAAYTCWHAAHMGGFIYFKAGQGGLVAEILGTVFTVLAAVTGFGLLQRWRWPRVAVEILGSVLFACSVLALLFSEVVLVQRVLVFVPAGLFALYSVVVALVVRYEPRASL